MWQRWSLPAEHLCRWHPATPPPAGRLSRRSLMCRRELLLSSSHTPNNPVLWKHRIIHNVYRPPLMSSRCCSADRSTSCAAEDRISAEESGGILRASSSLASRSGSCWRLRAELFCLNQNTNQTCLHKSFMSHEKRPHAHKCCRNILSLWLHSCFHSSRCSRAPPCVSSRLQFAGNLQKICHFK